MKKLLLLFIIPFLSFGQTPITDENIHEALELWFDEAIIAESIYGSINDWNVSNVTNMSYLFANNYDFNDDIGNWDVSNVTNMEGLFQNSYFNQDIGNWDVSNVTNMKSMFENTTFNQDIGNWDVGSVNTMERMFYAFNQNWVIGENMNPFNQNIEGWDVGNVVNMSYMFFNSMFNQNISLWDVGNITQMQGMFEFSNFNQDIGEWNVSNVTLMWGMFQNTPFNQDIGDWDVSNVTNMSGMFQNTPFNQDISNWDISNIIGNGLYGFLNLCPFSTANYDALLINWSQLELQDNVNFSAGNTMYCEGLNARTSIIIEYNWTINDGGYNCGGVNINEESIYKNLIATVDILGRETTNKGFQLHIYDDGTVEKKYLIK